MFLHSYICTMKTKLVILLFGFLVVFSCISEQKQKNKKSNGVEKKGNTYKLTKADAG